MSCMYIARARALSLFSTCVFLLTCTPTTRSSTLSLHDALPIYPEAGLVVGGRHAGGGDEHAAPGGVGLGPDHLERERPQRSEEHTSELQSLRHLVCRLLLEKKKKKHQEIRLLEGQLTGRRQSDI